MERTDTNSTPQLLTVGQVAERLSIGRTTAYRHVNAGTIPGGLRIGNAIRVDEAELTQWLYSEPTGNSDQGGR